MIIKQRFFTAYRNNHNKLRKSNIQKIYIKMGQKCCSQLPQRQYLQSMRIQNKNASAIKNNNLTLNQTPQDFDVPAMLQNVQQPRLNNAVRQTYQSLHPFQVSEVNRIKGTYATGKLINPQGSVYVGEWKDYMPHGKGIMYFSDGSLYQGIFNQGTPDKQGRLINNNGVYYEGKISNGEAFGPGKLANRYKQYSYDGNWEKDIPQGFGKQKWSENTQYQGQFVNGKKEGSGKYINKKFEYDGVFENDQINNNGKATFENGDTYEGMWKNGQMNGHGIYIWSDGSQYEGQFVNGHKNGKGKYKDTDGNIFQGIWKDGKRNGKGKLKLVGLTDPIDWEWKNDIPVKSI